MIEGFLGSGGPTAFVHAFVDEHERNTPPDQFCQPIDALELVALRYYHQSRVEIDDIGEVIARGRETVPEHLTPESLQLGKRSRHRIPSLGTGTDGVSLEQQLPCGSYPEVFAAPKSEVVGCKKENAVSGHSRSGRRCARGDLGLEEVH
jgi:hypothetical protein